MRLLLKIFVPVFLLFLISWPGYADGASVTYKTEVKVKLLPTFSFSLSVSGKYELMNLDTNETITINSPLNITTKDGKVTLHTSDKIFTSVKGFSVNETELLQSNQIAISKIYTRSGPAVVAYRGGLEISQRNNELLVLNKLDIEDYLKGVVASEMISSWHLEALKAQAVAARSYAYTQMNRSKTGYLESTVSSQVYGGKSNETSRSNLAVEETKGLFPLYNEVPIEAFFHSSSGGHTENSENVWKNPLPYIKGVPDPYDQMEGNYHYGWETSGGSDTIKSKLGFSNQEILVDLKVTEHGLSNSVQQVQATTYNKVTDSLLTSDLKPDFLSSSDSYRWIFGVSLKSINFNITSDSTSLIQMANGELYETNFLTGYKIKDSSGEERTIETMNLPVWTSTEQTYHKTSPSQFIFKGNGWGHLLGMSQWGARGMAEEGFTFDQILKHYYRGITVAEL
jgi:stage II sporulation protein D